MLDVINIRDWHVPGDAYDAERRSYGSHCERGTWGAAYIEGLQHYLDPGGAPVNEEARYFEEGSVRIHHVHTDSIFDFRPRSDRIGAGERKFRKSALEIVLDVLVQGSDADIERMSELLRKDGRPGALFELASEVDDDETIRCDDRLYVAVIGVYTDLKVKTVLTGVRTRYNLPNLAVSDTLASSATLERHLGGLDFASKVLDVEVLHGINDLVRFLGGSGDLADESDVVAADSFSRYQSFFQDRQNVLAYETQRLQDYLLLTERRARDVYETVKRANTFLLVWGGTFLIATLVLSILAAVGLVDWQLAAITGGLSLAQFLGAFFSQPTADLQRNLTNLAAFKMILESHSLKTALRALPPHDAADASRASDRTRGDRRPAADRLARAATRGYPRARPCRLREPARPRLQRGAGPTTFERCRSASGGGTPAPAHALGCRRGVSERAALPRSLRPHRRRRRHPVSRRGCEPVRPPRRDGMGARTLPSQRQRARAGARRAEPLPLPRRRRSAPRLAVRRRDPRREAALQVPPHDLRRRLSTELAPRLPRLVASTPPRAGLAAIAPHHDELRRPRSSAPSRSAASRTTSSGTRRSAAASAASSSTARRTAKPVGIERPNKYTSLSFPSAP